MQLESKNTNPWTFNAWSHVLAYLHKYHPSPQFNVHLFFKASLSFTYTQNCGSLKEKEVYFTAKKLHFLLLMLINFFSADATIKENWRKYSFEHDNMKKIILKFFWAEQVTWHSTAVDVVNRRKSCFGHPDLLWWGGGKNPPERCRLLHAATLSDGFFAMFDF